MAGDGNDDDVVGCLPCDLTAGRLPVPGGTVHATGHWVVEPCVGPLGLGALIVKPVRHVTTVGALAPGEAAELGPLLARAAAVVDELIAPEQVYVALWSHSGRRRGHIHFVVQPATTDAIDAAGGYGPTLQAHQFAAGEMLPAAEVERLAGRARALFAAG